MSKPITQEAVELLRRQTIQTMRKAARADKVPIEADALSFFSQRDLLFINAPISGLEKLDMEALLGGKPVLNETPIMYWYLSANLSNGSKGSVPAGFYTVVATQKTTKRGKISLRNARGRTVAEGDLVVQTHPLPPQKQTLAVSARIVSARITEFKVSKNGFKLCGEATLEVSAGPVTGNVTVSGCVEVSN